MAAVLNGQPLKVYSEFQRIDRQGNVVTPDRQERSREILSPAVIRNAYASFRVVIQTPPGAQYTMYVGQNPEDAVRVTLYREEAAGGDSGIADRLTKVDQPAVGKIGPGEAVHAYWVDLWVAPDAPVRRIKVEVQLHAGDGWVMYPMEVRVMPPIAVPATATGGPLPDVAAAADAGVVGPLREYLCGAPPRSEPPQLSVRGLVRRNALQDISVAKLREKEHGREEMLRRVAASAGITDPAGWCSTAEGISQPPGPEWFLKLRTLLYHGW